MVKPRSEKDKLDGLQRDSWQLELLVTGFALAGMISGASEFEEWTAKSLTALSGGDTSSFLAGGMVVCISIAYAITLINLFLHVVVRCLWIGAVGSRSVMGNTVFLKRGMAPVFHRFLQSRNTSFDAFIHRLDDIGSLIFALTFLLIAATLSFFLVIMVFSLIVVLVDLFATGIFRIRLLAGLALIYWLGALIYLLDFLTGSYLKRFPRFARFYYPVYRVYGWITLAGLYRPIYYNLLNKKSGKLLVYLLLPYLVACIVAISLQVVPSAYVAEEYLQEDYNSRYTLQSKHYVDEQEFPDQSGALIIPSQIIHSSPLRIRIPLHSEYNDYIAHVCPDLPRRYASAISSPIFVSGTPGYYDGNSYRDTSTVLVTPQTIECLTSAFHLTLDDRSIDQTDVFLSRPESSHGTEVIIFAPLDSLPAGIHRLHLTQYRTPRREGGTDTIKATITVPFYYSPTTGR